MGHRFDFFEKLRALRDWNATGYSVNLSYDLTVDLAPPLILSLTYYGKEVYHHETALDPNRPNFGLDPYLDDIKRIIQRKPKPVY